MTRAALVRTGLLAGLLVVATACGGGGEDVDTELPEGVEQPEIPPVSLVDNSFAPSRLEVPIAQQITIRVRNNGQNPHSFTIDALDVDTGVLEAGESAELELTVPKEEMQYYCTVHGADVMSGELIPT